MRDKDRIEPFLKELGELWKEDSITDLRFGQLIYLLADKIGRDIFFPENEEWLGKIRELKKKCEERD